MIFNKWFIIIIFLIIIIISLITFSNYSKTPEENIIEKFYETSLLDYSEIVKKNNNTINDLIYKLSTNEPKIQVNYDNKLAYPDYTDTITENISNLNKQLTDSYTISNDSFKTKITILENSVSDMEKIVSNLNITNVNDKQYNKIKSLNNGMEIQLVKTPNTMFKDYNSGSNIAGYMVMANDGCLSVGATDYDIFKCDDKNPKQLFKMEHILNQTAYKQNIDTSLPIENMDIANINYPFSMLKSINNENCLTNNHGSLSVQPCYSFIAQRWMPL